jgi:hypothetical protein
MVRQYIGSHRPPPPAPDFLLQFFLLGKYFLYIHVERRNHVRDISIYQAYVGELILINILFYIVCPGSFVNYSAFTIS